MVKTRNRVYRYHLTIYIEEPLGISRDGLEGWFNENCKKWVYQLEESKNGMRHFQCVISLIKKEFSKNVLSSISAYTGIKEDYINISPSLTGNTSFCYAMKDDTRVDGPWSNKMLEENLPVETLAFDKLYNWQKCVYYISMGKPDDRSIHWFYDTKGNRGKTQLTRMLLANHGKEVGVIPCVGTTNQLVSALINMGQKKTYLLDLPRAKTGGSWEERVAELMCTIEQLKNGLLVSAMYGKMNQLLIPHPNVIVFSNWIVDHGGLSSDRWVKYDMDTMSEEDWARELLFVQPDQLSPKEEEMRVDGYTKKEWDDMLLASVTNKKQDVLQCFSVCKDNNSYLDTLKPNVQGDQFMPPIFVDLPYLDTL